MGKPTTSDKKTNLGKIIEARVKELQKKPYVKTGFPATNQQHSDRSAGSKRKDEKTTIVEVALANEYGATTGKGVKIPERPYLRPAFDENRKDMTEFIGKMRESVLTGKVTIPQALGRVGARHVGQIQNKIRSNVPPPNAPSTIEAKLRKVKGNNKKDRAFVAMNLGEGTLRDTGQMIQAVGFEVVTKKGGGR